MQNVKYEIISCSYNEQNLYSQNWCQFSPTYIDCTRLIVFHFQWKWWRTVPRKCLCLGTLLNVLFCKQFQVFFCFFILPFFRSAQFFCCLFALSIISMTLGLMSKVSLLCLVKRHCTFALLLLQLFYVKVMLSFCTFNVLHENYYRGT